MIVDFSDIPEGWYLWHMTGPLGSTPSGKEWLVELRQESLSICVRKAGQTPSEAFLAAVHAVEQVVKK